MQDQVNPYAPPKAEVSDNIAEEGAAAASRGSRLGAAVLDVLVGFFVYLPMLWSMMSSNLQAFATDPYGALANLSPAAIGASLVMSVAWIVITIMLVSRNGQTIGKKLVGIKVVRSDGSKASLGRIFWLRNVVNALPSAIPVVGSLYSFVDALFIFGEKRQCLHDKIADTLVVVA